VSARIRRVAVLHDARPLHELHGSGAVLDGASCFRPVFSGTPRSGAMRFCLVALRSICRALQRFEQSEQALEQLGGAGRAAANMQVDRPYVMHAAHHRIASRKDAAVHRAIADRDHPFGIRRKTSWWLSGGSDRDRNGPLFGSPIRSAHDSPLALLWQHYTCHTSALGVG
jgi:hypothetical protein